MVNTYNTHGRTQGLLRFRLFPLSRPQCSSTQPVTGQ